MKRFAPGFILLSSFISAILVFFLIIVISAIASTNPSIAISLLIVVLLLIVWLLALFVISIVAFFVHIGDKEKVHFKVIYLFNVAATLFFFGLVIVFVFILIIGAGVLLAPVL